MGKIVFCNFTYDNLGNVSVKYDAGSMIYNSGNPYAVKKIYDIPNICSYDGAQDITYTSFDKVKSISQGTKTINVSYGADRQRVRQVLNTGNSTKTKQYFTPLYEVVNESGTIKKIHYLTSSTGLFVIFALDSNNNGTTSFDRGFTGHEHIYELGLINMNGRMYDPLMSAFLSPDNYMQDPTTQQGFNRYAYCMYNPLKYVDPTGEQYFGWNGNSGYADEQAERLVLRIRYNNYLESMQMTMERIDNFSNSLWSQGDSQGGAIGGNGCHGGGGRPKKATKRFNRWQQKQDVKSDEGKCVLTSLGSIMGGDSTAAWEAKAELYRATFDKNPFDPNNLIEFINWNPAPDVYTSYKCEEIGFTDIYDAMKQGNVVSFMCDFTDEMADMFGLTNKGHFVNLSYIEINNGCVSIGFNDHPDNNFFIDDYHSCHTNMFWKDDFQRFMYPINDYGPIMNEPRIIRIWIKKHRP